MEPATRHSLLLRLHRSEDQRAWSEFFDIYEPLIYRLARGRGLQHADACDLCQNVFSSVAQAIERWDPDPSKGSFRGWLFRIARNQIVNFLTSRRSSRSAVGGTSVQRWLEDQPDQDERKAKEEFTHAFRQRAFRWAAERVQGEFSATTWQAFWKTAVEEQSAEQAAKDLGISVGAVYVAKSRVIAKLRRRIQDWTEDD